MHDLSPAVASSAEGDLTWAVLPSVSHIGAGYVSRVTMGIFIV